MTRQVEKVYNQRLAQSRAFDIAKFSGLSEDRSNGRRSSETKLSCRAKFAWTRGISVVPRQNRAAFRIARTPVGMSVQTP